MTRQQAMARLIRDVQADIQSYGALQAQLETQFHAALRHDAPCLSALADEIMALVNTIEVRREDRHMLVHALTGEPSPRNLDGILIQLNPSARAMLEAQWHLLEDKVRACQALNTRNCKLIVEQHAIMQQVLHGEEGLYAEA